MSDSKGPPIGKGKESDSQESVIVDLVEPDDLDGDGEISGVIRRPNFSVVGRSEDYCARLDKMPWAFRALVDEICEGDELLMCEFSSILREFGELGVEAVLNFRSVYWKPGSTVYSRLAEIAVIRGIIKIIRDFTVDLLVSGDKAVAFLKNIALTANCQDLRGLTELMRNTEFLISHGHRCARLERALTINWNYLELLLFLNNYRCVMSLNGSVIAGEQMKAYMDSAQGNGVDRNFLN